MIPYTTPAIRALTATAVVGGVLYALKPEAMFLPDGQPRPWSQSLTRTDQIPLATPVPWWLAALAVGAAVDLAF